MNTATTVSAMTAFPSEPLDRVPQSTLEACARTGRAFTNEVRKMAAELIDLRARLEAQRTIGIDPDTFYPFQMP